MSLSVYLSIYTMGSFDLSLGEKNGPFGVPGGPILTTGFSFLKTLQVLYLSFSIYLSILSMSLSVYLAIYTMGSLDLSLGEKIYYFRPLEANFYLHGPQFPLLLLKFRT